MAIREVPAAGVPASIIPEKEAVSNRNKGGEGAPTGKGSGIAEDQGGDYVTLTEPGHLTGGASQIYQALNEIIKEVRTATDGISALPEFLRDIKTLIAKAVTGSGIGARGLTKGEGLSGQFSSLSVEWAEDLTLVDLEEDTARVLTIKTRLTLSASSLSISSENGYPALKGF